MTDCIEAKYWTYLTFPKSKHPSFDQVSTYAKRVLTFEKYPLAAEVKLKM